MPALPSWPRTGTRSIPTERGFRPGAGAVVAAIETAGRHAAAVTIGKPGPYLLEAAAALVGGGRPSAP